LWYLSDAPVLMAKLRAQRQHVLATLDGLSHAQLHTAVPPMTWAPIVALHHLALDVERWWFQAIIANDAVAWAYFEANPGGAWSVPGGTNVFSLYADECEKSDAVISAAKLDSIAAAWPEFLGPTQTIGQIVLHVTVETATHAGQLDIVSRDARWTPISRSQLTSICGPRQTLNRGHRSLGGEYPAQSCRTVPLIRCTGAPWTNSPSSLFR
jgi:Protein of unknown function (DUF664)